MAHRWYINPVVLEDGIRRPKAMTLIDPSTGRRYTHSSAIGAANWCLSLVSGRDFSAIDADPECIRLLDDGDEEHGAFLNETPRARRWSAIKLTEVKTRMAARRVNVLDVTDATPMSDILERVGARVMPSFKARGTWTK